MQSMTWLILAHIIIGILLSGCNLSRSAPKTITPATAPQIPAVQAVPSVTLAASSPSPPAPIPNETLRHSFYVCDADDPMQSARRIAADVAVDYAAKAARAAEKIVFVNREEAALTSIVLDVQVNQWDDSFWLDELAINEAAAAYELAANRLEIQLETPLPPGCQLEIGLGFRLSAAEIRAGLRAYRGFFGYSPRQLNLAHFLPTVAARINGEWRIHPPAGIGEQAVHEVADWLVTIKVENAADSLQLAAPGKVTDLDEKRWQVELANSRDFAISMSESFLVEEQEIDGLAIAVYTFPDVAGGAGADGPAHVMAELVKAFSLFEQRFGDYAYQRFVAVQGDFPDGIEFTGLVFIGTAWFYQFDGTHYNYLTLISVHEAAHQWWYARVGNDAALHPWLDEALATYSEYLFIEAYYPADKNWWWTFRVADFFPQGDVDSTVYEFTSIREYINAVYLRGVQMLHNLREDIGEAAFFELLREYGQAAAGQIAEPSLFWAQFTAEQIRLSQPTRDGFLRDPDVTDGDLAAQN